MSLKQSIVVVNEYTIKTGNKTGSRGGSPGSYVLRYMARNLATEDVTPVRLFEADSYITRYMARKEAAETLSSVPEIKTAMEQAQKDGGVAFGYGDVALSHEKLQKVSKDIQKAFDKGKTVMKTVLSFDEQYLKDHGILDPDFEFKKRGDFRGHIDQLKLRMAIMNGLDRLGRSYDDLQYVGVIQVDTSHVHCHLAMVDRGRGRLAADGTQKGKLSAKQKRDLRRGIDTYLDSKQMVKMMSSSVVYDKRNALCHIKKFTHRTMAQQGLPQFLMACLPPNRNWWRAGTNRKEMRKANTIVRDYVEELLKDPQSGYREAMQSIMEYADFRKEREGLSAQERDKLIRNGQNRLLEDCMNGVYSILRRIPESACSVRTPMLDVMSMDYEDMAVKTADDPMIDFGFKLRAYSSRLAYHKKEYHKYKDALEEYETTEDKSEDAQVMQQFFIHEMRYNEMLMAKYQYFLSFLPPDDEIEEEFNRLMEEKVKLQNLKNMRADSAFQKMLPENAEAYGIQVYGQYGGRRVKSQPEIIDLRIEKMQARIEKEEDAFRDTLKDSGLTYDGHGVKKGQFYSFEQVKALDLHHLGYDFPYDFEVPAVHIQRFGEMADKRYSLYLQAQEYLMLSEQELALATLPAKDIRVMKAFADELRNVPILESSRAEESKYRKAYTFPLGQDYAVNLKTAVFSSVHTSQLDLV